MIAISRTGRLLRRLVRVSCRCPLLTLLVFLLLAVRFQRVAYRIDPKQFEGNQQLLYLSTDELKEIRDKMFDHQEFMESFAVDPSFARLLEGVNTQMAAAFVSNLFDLGLKEKDLPVNTHSLRMLLDQIGARLATCGLVASLVVLPAILRLITWEAAAPAADLLTRSSAA